MIEGPAAARDAALFRLIADSVRDSVVVTDAELDAPGPRIEYVNAGFTRITGYRPDEVVGQTPRMLQGPRTDRALMRRLRAALAQGQSFFGTSVNYRKDGTEFSNEWMITPLRDGEGPVVRWISVQRDVTDRRHFDASQQILLDELNHRVMNNLAAVQSIAAMIGRTRPSIGEFRTALQQRLVALSQAQKAIADAHWHSVSLQNLSQAQLAPFGLGTPGRVEASGPLVQLRSGAAVVLGLALHELGLNSVKHGALSVPDGRVWLTWLLTPGAKGKELRIDWTEVGGGNVAAPAHRGFGLRLIEDVLVRQLRGKVQVLFQASGLRCLIDAPLATIAERDR